MLLSRIALHDTARPATARFITARFFDYTIFQLVLKILLLHAFFDHLDLYCTNFLANQVYYLIDLVI